jgi:hypothetical protein
MHRHCKNTAADMCMCDAYYAVAAAVSYPGPQLWLLLGTVSKYAAGSSDSVRCSASIAAYSARDGDAAAAPAAAPCVIACRYHQYCAYCHHRERWLVRGARRVHQAALLLRRQREPHVDGLPARLRVLPQQAGPHAGSAVPSDGSHRMRRE